MEIAPYIDHTLLKPNATCDDIIKLCKDAEQYNFRGVCVNPQFVTLACGNTDRIVSSVVNFPLGSCDQFTIRKEVDTAILDGAGEIDIVWNLSCFKVQKYWHVVILLHNVCRLISPRMLKVIVEVGYLEPSELGLAYDIVKDSGAQCIKTCTGFGPKVSIESKIKIIEDWKERGDLKIKASAGIRTYQDAKLLIEAGADILGTSRGLAIIEGGKHAD